MATYDARTALIVVDVQNDFADADGSLYVRGGEQIIVGVNDETSRAAAAGATVVFTQDWHPQSTPHFQKDGGVWPAHCVHDTRGAELHPALRVPAGAERVKKGVGGEDGYSAFTVRDPVTGAESATELRARLHARGVVHVVVCGLAADVCVKETALDALSLGFRTSVLSDLTRGVDLRPGDTERAFQQLVEARVTVE